MSVDERAKAGLFLAMQYPVEVVGSVSNFLRTAKIAIDGRAPAPGHDVRRRRACRPRLRRARRQRRPLQRLEILQMELLALLRRAGRDRLGLTSTRCASFPRVSTEFHDRLR